MSLGVWWCGGGEVLHLEQAPIGFGAVGLDEPEARGRPVRRSDPVGDHLEPTRPGVIAARSGGRSRHRD